MLESNINFTESGAFFLKAIVNFQLTNNAFWNSFCSYRIPNYEEYILNNPPVGSTNKRLFIKPDKEVITIGIMDERPDGSHATTLEIAVPGDYRGITPPFTEAVIGNTVYELTSVGYADENHQSGLILQAFTMYFFNLKSGSHIINGGTFPVYLR